MPDTNTQQFQIPANHPCLDGHFPDKPIVPGVMLLESVRIAALEWKPGSRIKAIPTAKFHRLVYPNEVFSVTLTELGPGSLSFECCCKDRKLASGRLTLEIAD